MARRDGIKRKKTVLVSLAAAALSALAWSGCSLLASFDRLTGGAESDASTDAISQDSNLDAVDSLASDAFPCNPAATGNDVHNCGSCNHDCQGGNCSGGVCQPFAIYPTVSTSQPNDVAIDSTYVYWANTDGTIRRIGKDGQNFKIIANLSSGSIQGIAVDTTYVYWTALDDGIVWRRNKDGSGSPESIATGQDIPSEITVDTSNVYWTNAGSGLADGGPNGTVQSKSLSTLGASATLIATGQDFTEGISVDSSKIFWVTAYGGTVMGIAKGGVDAGPPLFTSQSNPVKIVSDNQTLFWTSRGLGQVLRGERNGGGLIPLASNQAEPRGIAVNATSVFWVNMTDGTVMTIDKDGTCPEAPCPRVLASGQQSPQDIAVDSVAAYWTNQGDGTIRKVAY